ncbi:DUF177 domain-containing protein [candidate division WOR-3 bacterium]|nr:DUF177 domain-containing protein [candidate division WOR-3 bacterium]
MSRSNNPLVFHPSHIEQGQTLIEMEVESGKAGLESYKFTRPIGIKLDFDRVGDRIDLSIDLTAGLELNCSRCGAELKVEFTTSSRVTFLPGTGEADEQEVTATDLEFYTDEIDLRGIVRDIFLLSLPIAPLCRPDCKGLCPKCGADLNKGNCGCTNTERVSPFEELKRLVDE